MQRQDGRLIYGRVWLTLLVFIIGLAEAKSGPEARSALSDPGFFPIAVWLQNPANAERYHRAGINTYVALWRGPTEEQLAELKQAGMRLICAQNSTGLKHLDDPTILAWMHGDEPDNAQSEMLVSVTALNRQITALAPVLNSSTVSNAVLCESDDAKVPIASMVKRYEGATYVFAAAMREGITNVSFKVKNVTGKGQVEVIGEDRSVAFQNGVFKDRFGPWEVHLYRLGK